MGRGVVQEEELDAGAASEVHFVVAERDGQSDDSGVVVDLHLCADVVVGGGVELIVESIGVVEGDGRATRRGADERRVNPSIDVARTEREPRVVVVE